MTHPSYEDLFRQASGLSVSRETFDRLIKFSDLLLKWQRSINLIAPGEISHLWSRHIIDSIQLKKYIPDQSRIIDLGSGAGFPGLILSILGYDITLVESDQKKCSFLSEASLISGIQPTILNQRIESLGNVRYDVVTARACAPLDKLLHMSSPLMNKKSFCLFLKGKNYEREIEVAKQAFSFDLETHSSMTDRSGVILKISNLRST